MSNSRLDSDPVIENVVKTSLDVLSIGVDGLTNFSLSEIDQMGLDMVSNRFVRNTLIAPAFVIELCKNMLPYMRERDGNNALKNNFENIILKSTINLFTSSKMALSIPQQGLILALDKIGDVFLDENQMSAFEQSIDNLAAKMKENGSSLGEHRLLQELYSLKYDSMLYGNLFKLPTRFTEFINNSFFEMFKYVESYITSSETINISNTNEKIIVADAINIAATSSLGSTELFNKPFHVDSLLDGDKTTITQDKTYLQHEFIDNQIKTELTKEINLDQVRNRIHSDFDYSLPKKTVYTFNLPKNNWESGSDEAKSGLIGGHLLSGGSIHVSNNNRDGQLRWQVDLPPLPGVVALGLISVFSKLKDKTPDHIRNIHNSIALLEDSYKKSFSTTGFKNFFTKNFHGLSKNELIGRREQEVISDINKAINAAPNDMHLRKEGGYIISAIKNKDPEMLGLIFSHEETKSVHEQLDILYQKNLNHDVESFNSINKSQTTESFRAANDLVSKYPYEPDVHMIMARASKNVKNYDFSLQKIEQYRALIELNIHAMQNNSVDQQQNYLSGGGRIVDGASMLLKQFNTYIDHFKIDVLRNAIHDTNGKAQDQYKKQLDYLLHDILKTNPENVSYYDILVDLHLSDNQFGAAIDCQTKIVALNNSPSSLIRLAELYFENNEITKGNETLEALGNTFRKGSKEDYAAQCYLREWYIEQGDYDKASQHANTASLSSHATSIDQNKKETLNPSMDCEISDNQCLMDVPKKDINVKTSTKIFEGCAAVIEAHPSGFFDSTNKRNAISNKYEYVRRKYNAFTEDINKFTKNNAFLLQKTDAFISMVSLLANLKLRDRTINETTRKSLMALTSMISHVRSSIPFLARMIRPEEKISDKIGKLNALKDTHIQNLNMLITCLSIANWALQELQTQGLVNKLDETTVMYSQIVLSSSSLSPAAYELGFMLSTKTLTLASIIFSLSSIASTGLQVYQLKCRYDKVQLNESYNYHFLANSLWVAPAVGGIAIKLGVVGFATAKITAGFAIIWLEPVTGTLLIAGGAGTLGGVGLATYKGIEYTASSDQASALAFNGKLLAEKEDYLGAIDKLDKSLKCMPDPRVEIQRALYYCQHHFIKENSKEVNKEANKWLQNKEVQANDRLPFLNFRILTSIKNAGVSEDTDELLGMYVALAGVADDKLQTNTTIETSLKNNLSMLLCKSATETIDHLTAFKKLDRAKELMPDNNSIPTIRRSIEYDFEYKKGNQSQLLSKCISSLETNPKDLLALKYSGLVTMQQKKYKASQYYFKCWALSEPENINPHIFLSRSALFQEDFVAAKIHAKNALDLSFKLYNVKASPSKTNKTDTVEIKPEDLEILKSQYLESKHNYDAIQQGIATLYSCAFAQSAGKVSAEAIRMAAGSIINSFSSSHERNSTSHFSFSMWQRPGSYFKNTGSHNENECSRRFF